MNYRGIRTSVLAYYIHVPTPPHTHLQPPPVTLSLCVEYMYPVQLQKNVRGGGERGGGNGGGDEGYSCIFLFWVCFYLCPISPKQDTTHQVQPIVEAREYVYFLNICIRTLTSRSQLPPFLS